MVLVEDIRFFVYFVYGVVRPPTEFGISTPIPSCLSRQYRLHSSALPLQKTWKLHGESRQTRDSEKEEVKGC